MVDCYCTLHDICISLQLTPHKVKHNYTILTYLPHFLIIVAHGEVSQSGVVNT